MSSELLVLNVPDDFSESRIRGLLAGCHVTTVAFVRTGYGILAAIETASEEDAVNAETILDGLALPVPLGIVRGDSRIGKKLSEIVLYLTGVGSDLTCRTEGRKGDPRLPSVTC